MHEKGRCETFSRHGLTELKPPKTIQHTSPSGYEGTEATFHSILLRKGKIPSSMFLIGVTKYCKAQFPSTPHSPLLHTESHD